MHTFNIITQIIEAEKKSEQKATTGATKSSARAFILVGLIVIYRVNQSNL